MNVRELITTFGLDYDASGFQRADQAIAKLKRGAQVVAGLWVGNRAIQAVRGLINDTAHLGYQMQQTAESIGVNVQALQELHYAGMQTGVEIHSVDNAMQRFVRRTAQAAAGTGQAKDSLAAMHIKLRDSHGNIRAAGDLLNDVADAMARTKSQSERVRYAFDLFDTDGVQMVNMLKGGSAELKRLRAEAEAVGGVMDADLIKKTVAFTRNQNRLHEALQGVKNLVAKQVLPWLNKAITSTMRWVKANRELLSKRIILFLKEMTYAGRAVFEVVTDLGHAIQAIGRLVGPFGRGLMWLIGIGSVFAAVFGAVPLAILALLLAMGLFIDDIQTYEEGGDSLLGRLLKSPIKPDDWWPIKMLKHFARALADGLHDMDVFLQGLAEDVTKGGWGDALKNMIVTAIHYWKRQIIKFFTTIPDQIRNSPGMRTWSLLDRLAKDYVTIQTRAMVPAGAPAAAPSPTTPITVHQTINAAPGQSPKEVGDAAADGVHKVLESHYRRALQEGIPASLPTGGG